MARGKNHGNWKGGIYTTGGGIIINIGVNGKKNTISRARYVMQQQLGRTLTKEEVVVHLDRNKFNDSPENLVICNTASTASKLISKLIGKRKYKDFPPKELLELLYTKQKLSIREIERTTKINRESIRLMLAEFNIVKRQQGRRFK